MFSRFGLTNQNKESQLDALLTELPAVRPVICDMLTLASYQTDYGIFNHETKGNIRPLALVAMHDKEDVVEGGLLYKSIRQFHIYGIFKKFGLDLMGFLSLPSYVVDLLIDISKNEIASEDSVTRNFRDELE